MGIKGENKKIMNKCLYIISVSIVPLFFILQLLVSVFGLISGITNLLFLIGYCIVWHYVYKVIGDNHVRKWGRK